MAILEGYEFRIDEKTRSEDSLGQLGVVCVPGFWTRVHNVVDIQLLLQPAIPVRIVGEARDKFFGCALSGGCDAPPWQSSAPVVRIVLEAMVSIYGVKHSEPRCHQRCSPSGCQDSILDFSANLLFFITGHAVDTQIIEHSSLLAHLRV